MLKTLDRSISSVVTEAVAQYLQKSKIRPAFKFAMEQVIADNDELLSCPAK